MYLFAPPDYPGLEHHPFVRLEVALQSLIEGFGQLFKPHFSEKAQSAHMHAQNRHVVGGSHACRREHRPISPHRNNEVGSFDELFFLAGQLLDAQGFCFPLGDPHLQPALLEDRGYLADGRKGLFPLRRCQ